MINCYTVISNIKSVLTSSSAVSSGNEIVFGYNTHRLPNPLRKVYTVLKPLSLVSKPYEGTDAAYTKTAVFTVGINLHKAERYNPTDLLSRFTLIMDELEKSKSFGISESGFSEMKRNADTNSIILPCYVKLRIHY